MMADSLAPIVLFVYNRPHHARRTVESLAKNRLAAESDLFVFADGPKTAADARAVDEVRTVLRGIDGFRSVEIVEAERNLGLANSVIGGVQKVVERFGRVIVVEDDLLTSPDYLEYMNRAIDCYSSDVRIWSISGYAPPIRMPRRYSHDVYLSYRGCSIGWATWVDRWKRIDWSVSDFRAFLSDKGRIAKFNRGGSDLTAMLCAQMAGRADSWAIRWCYAQSKLDTYTVYPVRSKVYHIGNDGSGTHTRRRTTLLDVDYGEREIVFPSSISLDPSVANRFRRFYSPGRMRRFRALVSAACRKAQSWCGSAESVGVSRSNGCCK